MDPTESGMLQSFKELYAVCILAEMKRASYVDSANKGGGASLAPAQSNKNFEFF
jgi:hypothetical protein